MNTRRSALLATAVALLALGTIVGTVRLLAYVQPAPEAADVTFLGPAPSYAGFSLASAGDVNGDGLDDILVGAPFGQAAMGRNQTGRAYLVLGRRDADWGTGFDLTAADASFVGEEAHDWVGGSVVGVGDVNGDGLDDMLLGAYKHSATDVLTQCGKTYLVLGRREADWGGEFDLATADASFVGQRDGEMSGRDVAGAGDVNGDGLADFLVGAYLAKEDGVQVGKAHLILGRRAADWGRERSLASADATFLGRFSGDFAGYALDGAGDVNGDGLDDFLVGAHGNDDAFQTAGKVYLLLGRAAANWGRAFSLGGADAAFDGESVGNHAGDGVATAGDVNGDGLADFLIGAAHYSVRANSAGKAYLVLGRAAADWGTDFGLGGADASFEGVRALDEVGFSLAAAGDVDGDGRGELLIGAARFDPTGVLTDSGRAYLVPGRAEGWQRDVDLASADTDPDLRAFDGEAPGDRLGEGVAGAGDVNGDGLADFVLGAPDNDEAGNGAGKVYLVLGAGVGAGLELDKRASAAQVVPGAAVSYRLSYTNSMRADVTGVRVVDVAPAGLGFIECSGGITCTRQGRRVSWFLGDVAAGTSGRVHLALRVPEAAPAGAVITNTAWITAPSRLSPVFAQAVSRVVTGPTSTATRAPTDEPTVRPMTPTATSLPTDVATVPPTVPPTDVATQPPTAPPTASATPEPPTPTAEPGARVFLPVAHRQ